MVGDRGLQKTDLNPALPDSEVQVLSICQAAGQGEECRNVCGGVGGRLTKCGSFRSR